MQNVNEIVAEYTRSISVRIQYRPLSGAARAGMHGRAPVRTCSFWGKTGTRAARAGARGTRARCACVIICIKPPRTTRFRYALGTTHSLLCSFLVGASAETTAPATRMALSPSLHAFAINALARFATTTANHTWASSERCHASKFTHTFGLQSAATIVFKDAI